MRLRAGRTSASGSAGKTGDPAAADWARVAAPGAAARAPPAAKRSAPSASNTPACSATSTGASLSAATPAAIGAMRAPCPTRTTGPSILLLSYRLWTLRATPSNSPRKMRPCDSPLVGEVGELALGEDGAAAGDGDAVRAGLGQGDGVLERPAETGAESFDGLAGACRTALVGLVAHAAGGVPREDRVAAASDPDDVDRSVRVQPGGGLLLRDLLRHAAEGGLAEALPVHTGGRDAGQTVGVQFAVELEEGVKGVAEVALRPRLQHAQIAVRAELPHGERRGDLSEVDTEEQPRPGGRGGAVGRLRARACGGVVHAFAYTRAAGRPPSTGRPSGVSRGGPGPRAA